MQVAELIAPHCFQVVQAPVREPGPGEILVRVDAVGICGSDLHSYSEGAVGDTPCEYPQVLGHEPAGTVVRAGAGVSGWSAGDRAALEPAIYCYHCEFCRTGHHNVCEHIRFLSMPGDPGFFREYVTLPAGNLLAIPPGLGAAEATIVEPLAVVLHSMQFAAVRPGETAVVFGSGPIGLLTVICLKLHGAGRVWAVEPVAHRREMARTAGADAVLDPAEGDPVQEILRETGGRGVDVAIDCATKKNTVNQCLHAARNAGRVVITGIPSEVSLPVEFSPLRRKELTIYNVRRSNHESARALALLLDHVPRFAALITHQRSLAELPQAFEMVERRSDGAGKVIVTP